MVVTQRCIYLIRTRVRLPAPPLTVARAFLHERPGAKAALREHSLVCLRQTHSTVYLSFSFVEGEDIEAGSREICVSRFTCDRLPAPPLRRIMHHPAAQGVNTHTLSISLAVMSCYITECFLLYNTCGRIEFCSFTH